MLWDTFTAVFIVLALGVAFGAVPVSGIVQCYLPSRRSYRPGRSPAAVPKPGGIVIPFPAARLDLSEADETPLQSRRA